MCKVFIGAATQNSFINFCSVWVPLFAGTLSDVAALPTSQAVLSEQYSNASSDFTSHNQQAEANT